jgi:CRP-like cAMP-binding protein
LLESTVERLPLFNGLARRHLASVARNARLSRVPRGVALTRRGGPAQDVIAVAEGMLKLSLQRADGAERVVRFVAPGESFGEAAALLARPSAVDATALADSVVVVIRAAAIRSLMSRDPEFSRRMATLLAARMLDLITEVEASELRPAAERLAGYLLSLTQPGNGNAPTARLPTTKTLVASRLGMKKETLSRLLHDFVSRRVIEVSRRDIAILDPATLAEIARI